MTEHSTPTPTPNTVLPSSAENHGLWRSGPKSGTSVDPDGLDSIGGTTLGPFEVHEVIGEGGMSVVLSGIHVEQRVPVAIKIITNDDSIDPKFRTRLRDEVQAAAALSHPGIVTVFDYGEIDEKTEALTDQSLPSGTPYFVMERTTKGTLLELAGRVRWKQAKSILLTLLDALAHAHAADVIHRDIKPVNVLLAQWGGRVIPKLADFGIAFAMEGDSSSSKSVGTPRYMAPEQIDQPWRRHGPWSDLYAVGCVAHELVSGDQLFASDDLREVYRQHLLRRQPTVDPIIPVPEAFQDWLDKLLARNPGERFQSAAAAAHALFELDDSEVPDIPPPGAPTYDVGRLAPVLAPLLDEEADKSPSALEENGSPEGVGLEELPDRWPQKSVERQSIRFVGAGLGLYGLRSLPLIGRDWELDKMWGMVDEVQETAQSRALIVRGSQGCGKSRLVEWFTQRLREFGAASILRATHSAKGDVADGLSGMLARHFRTLGASNAETEKIVRNNMGEYAEQSAYEWQTMTQIVRPSLAGDHLTSTGIQIASSSQRYAVIHRYLNHLAEDRPVVVWCDDAQWGSDALEFAKFVQQRRSEVSSPIFFVVNVTEDALAERPDEREILEELLEDKRADEMSLDPLDPVHHEKLVEELLYLEGDLARDVVRRTAGNPLFAVELIGDWVQRGVLEVGERGFVLRDGVEPTIPDHLHEVWAQRIGSLLDDHDDDARSALELAAALGRNVRVKEWRKVCELAGVELEESLSGELVERRFAQRTKNGFSFAHAILRESIERLARDRGRWQEYRRACASMVEHLYDVSTPRVAERYGQYAMSAGQYERALEPLIKAARGRRRRGEYREAQQLVSDYMQCLEDMGVGDADPRWGEAWVTRARTYLNDRRPREAEQWAGKALEAAREHGWSAVRARAMGWRALAAQWLGQEDAGEYLQRAFALVVEEPSDHRMRGAYGSIAHGLTRLREFEDAEKLLDLDLEEAERYGDERLIANNQYLRCRHAFFQEKWEEALEFAETARSLFEAAGHLPGVGLCQEYLAEIHRRMGNPDRAADIYRSCVELQEAIGQPKAVAQTNLATLQVKNGDPEEAEKLFVEAATFFESSGRKMFQMVAVAGLMACAATQAWWGNIREHLELLESFVAETEKGERDLAELLEFAGDHLRDGTRYEFASRVYELARRQWTHLGEDDRVREVEGKLAECR